MSTPERDPRCDPSPGDVLCMQCQISSLVRRVRSFDGFRVLFTSQVINHESTIEYASFKVFEVGDTSREWKSWNLIDNWRKWAATAHVVRKGDEG